MGTWLVGKLQTDQDRERLRDGLIGVGPGPEDGSETLLDATRKRVFLLHDVHRKGPVLLHSRWAMSYLRGPADARGDRAPHEGPRARRAGRGAAAGTSAGPPVLPPPLEHHFLSRHGGAAGGARTCSSSTPRATRAPAKRSGLKAWPLGSAPPRPTRWSRTRSSSTRTPRHRRARGRALLPTCPSTRPGRTAPRRSRRRSRTGCRPSSRRASGSIPSPRQSALPGEDAERVREAPALRRARAAGGRAARAAGEEEARAGERRARAVGAARRRRGSRSAAPSCPTCPLILGRRRSVSISGASSVLSKNRMENEAEERVEERLSRRWRSSTRRSPA